MSFTGKIVNVKLKGMLLPWQNRPVTVQINGCKDHFLPVFSTPEKLREAMQHLACISHISDVYTIKQVDNPTEFLDSVLNSGVRVMLDPIVINDNKTRWIEIVWKDEMWKFLEANQ